MESTLVEIGYINLGEVNFTLLHFKLEIKPMFKHLRKLEILCN